jgi:hypothetical protein
MSSSPTTSSPSLAVAALDVFCGQCGYNLRASTAERCPECGVAIDRATLSGSTLPWRYRRYHGLWRAYWRTVRRVSFHRRQFAQEMQFPTSYGDARRFWLLTSLLVCAPMFLGAVAMWILQSTGAARHPILASLGTFFGDPAGIATALSAEVIGLFLFLLAATGVPSYLCHPRSLPVERQNRAVALSHYAAAPLAFFPLVLVVLGLGLAALSADFPGGVSLTALASLGGVTLLFFWYLRTATLTGDLTARGWRARVLITLALPILWAMLAVLLLGVLPFLLYSLVLFLRIAWSG